MNGRDDAAAIPATGAGARQRNRRGPWSIGQETLVLLAALYLTATANAAFFRAVADTGLLDGAAGAGFALTLFTAILALNGLLLLLLINRWTARPLLALLLVVSACASYYMWHYRVYLDADMIRNILHTDRKEAGELLSLAAAPWVLAFGVLPALALRRVELKPRTLKRACLLRLPAIGVALLAAVLAIGSVYQPLASLMRNHREVRYLVTPGNYLVSLATVLKGQRQSGPKTPVGTDAKVVGKPASAKPRLLVLVIGETVRAQNWGLNGYARQTTPQLAKVKGLINFTDVTACGSSTEVSLPCVFSSIGRRNYDARRITGSEGLLHVLEHAGIHTLWRDNQSGCKGVCDASMVESFSEARLPGVCGADGCMDQAMLHGLVQTVDKQPGDVVVVLHQMGSHGPAYYKRYPKRLEQFRPVCTTDDLGKCSREKIVNAYDNSLLHTDDFVAQAIRLLSGVTSRDTALIYVSDHGESLGEDGLFLHGMPYAIAPRTQTKVPMVMWVSDGFVRSRGLDRGCLGQLAGRPVSHDNLFHSVLGLMQVSTAEAAPTLDLFGQCSR